MTISRLSSLSMSRRWRSGVSAAALTLLIATSSQAAELKLTRVVLSNSGLGQFTHSGAVAPGVNVDLAVRLDQVDDVLKSLTIFDKAGAIGTVTLPGKAPLTELFKDLPFGPKALSSQSELLNALVGAEVELEGAVAAKGRVFRVEAENVALPNNGGVVTRHRLTLFGDKGLVQAMLEDATALRFTDAKIQAQIARALSALAENEAKDRRRLTIGFAGAGEREAAIGYVVAAPIWKTAYRLVLSPKGATARLQGWAVLENLTGGDWDNVDLTLVSGNPAAFHQPLYTALFADRIEIPVETTARLKPGTDTGEETRDVDEPRKEAENVEEKASARSRRVDMATDSLKPVGAMTFAAAAPAPAAPPPDLASAANVAETEESSTQLLYQFPAKVSLPNGHTMMAPIIDREIAADRVWLYQPGVSDRHPLAAARLHNEGDAALPKGLVTAYETGADGNANFVGDARMPLLGKGSAKFVTFALDSKTDIRREDKGLSRITLGKAARGIMTLETRYRRTLRYEVTAPADDDRTIVVEEPRENGWSPTKEEAGVETTTTEFRKSILAPKGKTTSAKLELERVDSTSVQLAALDPREMFVRLTGLQNASPSLKAALANLQPIVEAIDAAQARRSELAAERKKIGEDQNRIRENLRTVGAGSDLGHRYIDTLKAQEDRLAEITKLDEGFEKDLIARRKAAADFARELTLD